MSDVVAVAIISAIVPTLAVLLQWYQQFQAAKKARQELEANKIAAIARAEALRDDVADVHTLVNSKADVQVNKITALEKEIARLNREGTPTPTIEAGQGNPGEVGIEHGVVTAERVGPFPPKPDDRE